MKKIIILCSLMTFLTSAPSFGGDCQSYIGTCDYYLCRENKKHCGQDGYFIGFGYKFCHESLSELAKKVSPEGKTWLTYTATCLQKQLEDIDDVHSCSEIQRKAISGHNICYEEANFCSLSLFDKMKIFQTIGPALKEEGVLFEGFQVLTQCLKNIM